MTQHTITPSDPLVRGKTTMYAVSTIKYNLIPVERVVAPDVRAQRHQATIFFCRSSYLITSLAGKAPDFKSRNIFIV